MNGHPTREEDFDLWALGALEGDEKLAIESHAASCADCAHKLAQAQGRISLLAFAAPRVEPAPAVKQRLMQQVRAASEAAAPEIAWPDRGAGEGVADKPAALPRTPYGGFFGKWWAAVLIPAAAALALAALVLWNENQRVNRQVADLRAVMQQQQQELEDARAMADLVADPNTVIVTLEQQPDAPTGSGHVLYNLQLGTLLYDGLMAPAPAEKSYQLWLVPVQGNPISAGVFNPVVGQANRWSMKMPPGVKPKAFAVTLEPAGGKPQPTGPKVLVGAAS
jgi:anti-sigma-K factor RskA